jgi:sugar-phosphatase
VTARIISRAISLVEENKPLLPGVREAVALCKAQGLKVGLASASPLHMLEKVLIMFELRDSFDALASAENCLTASRTRRSIWTVPLSSAGSPQLRCAGRFR